MAARRLPVNGIELAYWESGGGPPVALLHETAATAEAWRPLAAALATRFRAVAHDRRGWGGSGEPEGYMRTTVEEQAEDAAALLAALGIEEAVVCGAGLGAVAALDLLLRRPDLVRGAVLVEPPLLAFLPDATEGLSADREAIAEAVEAGGPAAALDLFLSGGLPYLGPGAARLPETLAAAARERPGSLFAELAAVPAWPIRGPDLLAATAPVRIVIGAATPDPLRRAAEELAARLGGAELTRLGGVGLPHLGAAPELARVVAELHDE